MAILQVKSVPDELYAALGKRAKREGVSMSELVIRTLSKELAKPTMAEWVERVRQRTSRMTPVDFDSVALLDEVRAEREDYLLSVWQENNSRSSQE